MQRDGIVNLGADFPLAKKLAQFIAAGDPDHVLMTDVKCMWRSLQRPHSRVTLIRREPGFDQQTIVCCSASTALLVPGFDMRQLYSENRSLNRVHAAVPADLFVMVASRTAVIAQFPHVLSQIQIARGHQSRVAVRAQVLGGVKTERRSRAE